LAHRDSFHPSALRLSRGTFGDYTLDKLAGAAYAFFYMAEMIRAASPTYKLVAIGAYVVGGIFGLLGVWLVYLGSQGNTDLSFFGQTVKTTNVGIAAIFIGAATVVLLIRRLLKSIDGIAGGDHPEQQ
jgi:hypothetical protein